MTAPILVVFAISVAAGAIGWMLFSMFWRWTAKMSPQRRDRWRLMWAAGSALFTAAIWVLWATVDMYSWVHGRGPSGLG